MSIGNKISVHEIDIDKFLARYENQVARNLSGSTLSRALHSEWEECDQGEEKWYTYLGVECSGVYKICR